MLFLVVLTLSFSPRCWLSRPAQHVTRSALDVRAQIREWPNLNGERIVRKTPARKKDTAGIENGLTMSRGNLVLGVLGAASWSTALFAVGLKGRGASDTSRRQGAAADDYDDGDAVTSPEAETEFLQLAATPPSQARDAQLAALVEVLERREGAQLYAAEAQGRWVLPWVGGWECVWSAQKDRTSFGGPAIPRFDLSTESDGTRSSVVLQNGNVPFKLLSARQFIYGPGEGGVTVEYLYSSPGVAPKLLLSKNGTATNLGGNRFQFDMPLPFEAYEATVLRDGVEALTSRRPLSGSVPLGGGAMGLQMRTSYLSPTLWLIRGANDDLTVWERTETRSVMDRRGLVADGQLKPPDDEGIRYGRLLFGEDASDYEGWDAKVSKENNGQDRLLGRT